MTGTRCQGAQIGGQSISGQARCPASSGREMLIVVRVPNAGQAEQERQALIRRLNMSLTRFQSIPISRREAECADEGEATCRRMLGELGAPGYENSTQAGEIEALSIDEFLSKYGQP
ncbi:MAG: hypothetical protein E8G75_04300 [Sulfitobacter sp. SK025]|nr:MAG: hypothetical protein E8G75_04300 [Sulfitobacter sp. SK025]